MIYKAIEARIDAKSERLSEKVISCVKDARIDRTETSFGGKGCLTKEQYEQAMALVKKMRNVSAW